MLTFLFQCGGEGKQAIFIHTRREWLDAFNFVQGPTTTLQRVMPDGTLTAPGTFGEDSAGEIYVSYSINTVPKTGRVLRLEPQ